VQDRSAGYDQLEAIKPVSAGACDASDVIASRRNECMSSINQYVCHIGYVLE
jgi:hypothetical protein